MALTSRAVSVATTATRLDTVDETDSVFGSSVAVHNNGAATVFVGGSSVTTAAGFPVAAGTSVSLDVQTAEGLWGIVASGTVEVRVLEVGV